MWILRYLIKFKHFNFNKTWNLNTGILCLLIALFAVQLVGCSKRSGSAPDGAPKRPPSHLDRVPDAKPKVEPLSKYGNRFKKNTTNTYVAKKRRYAVMSTSRGYRARGLASWYGTKFHGRRTSSGEKYDMYAMTAAHPTLPLPTYAKVTNLDNGKSVIVKVNDRGPFHANRLIDVSYVAAHKLGMLGRGTGRVQVESVDPRDNRGFSHNKKRNNFVPMRSAPSALMAKNASGSQYYQPGQKHPGKPNQSAKSTQTSGKKFYVQLGSFNQKARALAIAKQVGKMSPVPTQITELRRKKGNTFRVRMGPVTNQQEAVLLSKKLAPLHLSSNPVVIAD